MSYHIPVETHRITTTVSNSRFITTIAPVTSAEEAKAFLAQVRKEMPDASHHVYAFRIGYGNSVIEGMSDDGEPSGTAGPPVLAVLRGTNIGDLIVIVTRYFGGTKLGTGGLVRAYSEAAHTALNTLKTEEKTARQLLGLDIPYKFYEQVKHLISANEGVIQDETFAAEITVLVIFPLNKVPVFTEAIRELSAGKLVPVLLGPDY